VGRDRPGIRERRLVRHVAEREHRLDASIAEVGDGLLPYRDDVGLQPVLLLGADAVLGDTEDVAVERAAQPPVRGDRHDQNALALLVLFEQRVRCVLDEPCDVLQDLHHRERIKGARTRSSPAPS